MDVLVSEQAMMVWTRYEQGAGWAWRYDCTQAWQQDLRAFQEL